MKKMELLKEKEYNNAPKPKRVEIKRAVSEKSIFELMEDVLMLTEKKKLSDVSLKQCDKQLQELSSRLELPVMACLFLSVIVDQGNVGGVEVSDFAEFFDCRSMRIMGYNSLLTLLEQHGYIYSKGVFDFEGYKITNAAMEALKKNEPYHVPAIHDLTIDQFFSFLDDYFTDAEDENVSSELLQTRIDKLIEHNQELKLCQTINKYRNVSLSDRMSVVILLFLCHQLVNNNDEDVSVNEILNIINDKRLSKSIKSAIQLRRIDLIAHKWVEIKKSGFFQVSEYVVLTKQAKEKLLSECDITLERKAKEEDLVAHQSLPYKELFYNAEESASIARLSELLQEENYREVQERLLSNGFREGFTALFYGSPGTGKTETVYQLAKQTGRDIFVVNVSEIKSMWVGESEKNIKELFDTYRTACENSGPTPILLFNEADAVLGVRQEGATKAVDKMENSIQNIILQEMEHIKGIMIATTNLTGNLDTAFDRRFLYKIEFKRPCLEAKRAIWKNMLKDVDSSMIDQLASEFDLSGGEIENVVRKMMVDMVLSGSSPEIDQLREYCRNEGVSYKRKITKVGFVN